MTPQKVISELNKLKTGAPCSDVDKRDKAIEIAKEAVVSTEARKPIYYELEGGDFECPRCYELVDDGDRFCSNCGQALDWGGI